MCCHRSARCLSISGLVLVTYGHSITGNDVCLCWKQQSNVFEFEDSGNLTFKVSVHVFPGKMVSLAYYWLLTGGYKGEKMYEVFLGLPYATMYFNCMGAKGIWKYRGSLRF